MDKLVGTFSSRRKTNRWPLTVFFNMLDVAELSAFVIWLYNNHDADLGRSRRNFLISLGEQPVAEEIRLRVQNPPALQKHAKQSLITLGYTCIQRPSAEQSKPNSGKKRRCELCPRQRDRKIRQVCYDYGKSVCYEHSTLKCIECL